MDLRQASLVADGGLRIVDSDPQRLEDLCDWMCGAGRDLMAADQNFHRMSSYRIDAVQRTQTEVSIRIFVDTF